jgi:hypothetical protein
VLDGIAAELRRIIGEPERDSQPGARAGSHYSPLSRRNRNLR